MSINDNINNNAYICHGHCQPLLSGHPSPYSPVTTLVFLTAYDSDVFSMVTVVWPPRSVVTLNETSFRSCTTNVIQPDWTIPWHVTGHHVTMGVTKHPADNSEKEMCTCTIVCADAEFYLMQLRNGIHMPVLSLQVSLYVSTKFFTIFYGWRNIDCVMESLSKKNTFSVNKITRSGLRTMQHCCSDQRNHHRRFSTILHDKLPPALLSPPTVEHHLKQRAT